MIDKKIVGPKLLDFPERITLELTNKCNLSCVFCPRRMMTSKQGAMAMVLAKRLIDEMADHLPVSLVPFFRGEPLLNPHWDDILKYAKEKGIGPIQLTSNGTLLDIETAEKIIDLEIDFLSISLDTVDSDLYENTRRGANYSEVIGNIIQFLKLKEKRGVKYPEVQVSAVETEELKGGMKDFIRFWQTKVDRVRIYVEHSKDNKPGTIATPLPDFPQRLPCHKVFNDIVILWDGNIALCNHDWTREKEQVVGNVLDNSILEIWHSAKYKKIRNMHNDDVFVGEHLCENCDHWKMFYLSDGYLGRLYTRETLV